MKTERLYYDDPELMEFDATILDVIQSPEDPRGVSVELDRTAFHPTGGGQPHDTGILGGFPVVDVVACEEGRVLHRLAPASEPTAGAVVFCQVDRPRRRDHLQQHSGQHLLSAAFVRARDAATRSFHMGGLTSTLDLDRLPEALGDLQEVEDLANRVIEENRPMSASVVGEAEARSLPLRKELPVRGAARIVSIEGFDMTPCGGTHARRTGEIGGIGILSSERHRGGTRVEFVAGRRLRLTMHRTVAELTALGESLSAPAGQRVDVLERLLADRRRDARRVQDLARRAGEFEALTLIPEATDGILRQLVEDRSRAEIEAMARALACVGVVAILGWQEGSDARIVIATPGTPHAGNLLQSQAVPFGARGGGGPGFAQAGGLDAGSLEPMLQALERAARLNRE